MPTGCRGNRDIRETRRMTAAAGEIRYGTCNLGCGRIEWQHAIAVEMQYSLQPS